MNKISQLNRSTEQSFTHSPDYTNRASAHSHPTHSPTIHEHFHPCIHQLDYIDYPTHSSTPPEHVHAPIHTSTRLYTDYTQLTYPLLSNMSMHTSTHQLDYKQTIPTSLIHSSRTCPRTHPHINRLPNSFICPRKNPPINRLLTSFFLFFVVLYVHIITIWLITRDGGRLG